ncbi:hypothetical protein HU720_17180 [Pseudomonas sp. SWRI51]|uniref:hypothetical protein n=1 Tax=Pseudomonas sp. SWRI51 TaxID=2745491 RepID=UPI001644A799|nr:hypothetical protein [Pseudomonas sp. SWRI51]MBC3413026.1 hypothetical protein [Pseudomonas sp. SWRI51]
MGVFTVYFSGTGSNRADDHNPLYWEGELIATLADSDQGKRFIDWIAIDGPGSGNHQHERLFVQDQDHYEVFGTAFGSGWDENVQHALNVIKGHSDWRGDLSAEGEFERIEGEPAGVDGQRARNSWMWQRFDHSNRKITLQELEEQLIKEYRKPLIPDTVNLVGWSRGAICCHMLANAMAKDPLLSAVKVNIFAVDPVPGPFNLSPERYKLQSNVAEYVGFYARDERSMGFAAVIPFTEPGTQISVWPLPGRHATLVGNASLDGVSEPGTLKEPGRIVRFHAADFLGRWGTVLNPALKLDQELLDGWYVKVAEDDAQYLAMRKHSYTVFTEEKDGQRWVYHGDQAVAYDTVNGEPFNPSEGLNLKLWKKHAEADEA